MTNGDAMIEWPTSSSRNERGIDNQRRKISTPTAKTVSGTKTGEIRTVVMISLPRNRYLTSAKEAKMAMDVEMTAVKAPSSIEVRKAGTMAA